MSRQTTVQRDRWGRPLIIPPHGGKPVAYTRTTTFIDGLEPQWNLTQWKRRMVALGLAERPDLVLAVANARDNRAALDRICDDAAEAAKASASSITGTALHGLCQRHDEGGDLGPIPPHYQPDIEAYKAATAHMKMLAIEELVVLDSWKVAGTPDRIVRIDGKKRIADIKTGSLEYGMGKIAAQLACYARSMAYDPATGKREYTGVEHDWGIVIHLPAGQGRCDLYKVDLIKGWEGVQIAKRLRDWQKHKFDHWAEPLDSDTRGSEPSLMDAIANAQTLHALEELWIDHRDQWTDEHTALAARRKAEIQAEAA